MQSSPVSALPGVVPAKAQASDNISASGLPVAEATDDPTFESLLAQQTQAQSAPLSDELALLIGQQVAANSQISKDNPSSQQAGSDDASPQEETSVMFSDLAALFATLVQAAAPMQRVEQTVAPAKTAADVAKPDGVGVDAGHNILSLVPDDSSQAGNDLVPGIRVQPGKDAAEIAGTGKDLPVAEVKVKLNAFQLNEPTVAQNLIQVDGKAHATHPEIFSQITGVQGNNSNGAVTVSVEPRVGAPGWDAALGQKVAWLVNQRHQVAEMQLNPPNLGPLEVKITIANDQASALFVSHHAAVRDAIEAALPRLREMLAENGIMLGNAQVSAESFPREQAANGDGRPGSGWQPEVHDMEMLGEMGERTGVMRLRTPGSVDIFA